MSGNVGKKAQGGGAQTRNFEVESKTKQSAQMAVCWCLLAESKLSLNRIKINNAFN